jgi:RHS repeat-associated protein
MSQGELQSARTETEDAGMVTVTHDLDGNRLTRQLDNATQIAYTYDNASRLTQWQQTGTAGTIETLNYAYNSVNDRTSKETINGQYPSGVYDVYGYDAIDQVTNAQYTATAPSGTGSIRNVGYTLDPLGNRTQVTDSTASTVAYAPNNLNQYSAVGGTTFSYDGNGNLTSGDSGTYAYDARNRLSSGTVGGVTTTLAYDGRNRCVSRTVGSTTTFLIYDGWNLINEYVGASTTPSQTYVHGAAIDEMGAKKDASGSLVYYCADALGSTTYLTDITGLVAEHYTYDIYGAVSIFDQLGNPLTASFYGNRFFSTGREFLSSMNVYDYRNRYYSQDLGRWLSRDPLKDAEQAQGPNLYEYVGNDPIRFTDPLGLWQWYKNWGGPDWTNGRNSRKKIISLLIHQTQITRHQPTLGINATRVMIYAFIIVQASNVQLIEKNVDMLVTTPCRNV